MAYKYSSETYNIIKAAYVVYNTLGYGFKEEVYQEAMERELDLQKIPFEPQKLIRLYYKGRQIFSAIVRLLLSSKPFRT